MWVAWLVNPFHDLLFHRTEGADVADTIPGVRFSGLAPDGFVTLEETRQEELFVIVVSSTRPQPP